MFIASHFSSTRNSTATVQPDSRTHPTPSRWRRRTAALVAALALALAACGSNDDAAIDTSDATPAEEAELQPVATSTVETAPPSTESTSTTELEPMPETVSGQIRISAIAEFELNGGTWTAEEGGLVLGCAGGTFVDEPIAAGILRLMTCEEREDDGVIAFEFSPEPGETEGTFVSQWSATTSDGVWAGLTGAGDWVGTLNDSEDGAEEVWTGEIELTIGADADRDASTDEASSDPADESTEALLERQLDALRVPEDAAGALTFAVFGHDPEPVVVASAPQAADTSDPIRLGGLTSLLSVTTALSLIDDGLMDLDDLLIDHIDRVPVPDNVTVRHVLEQRAGFEEHVTDEYIDLVAADPSRVFTPEEVLDFVDTTTTTFEPGSMVGYTETTYIMLGVLVEEVSGQPYHEVVRERVLTPAGMTSTHLPIFEEGEIFQDAYTTFTPSGDLERFDFDDTAIATAAWSAGGYVSSIEDMHHLLVALFAGDIVSDSLVAEMTASDEPIGMSFYSWDDDDRVVTHFGGIPGFENFIAHEPTTGVTMYLLSTDAMLSVGGAVEPLVEEIFPESPTE